MISLRNFFKYSIPLGLLAFFGLTMRTVASYTDESMTSYGFPFPCYGLSSVSSMAYELAIGPFIIDVIFYILICHTIISLAIPKLILSSRNGNVVAILLWLTGLGSMIFMLIAVSIDPHFVTWKLDGYFSENAARTYHFHFGPGLNR